jgi:hypothetical protein
MYLNGKSQFIYFMGEHDHSTEVSVAKAYFDSLNAPVKKWHIFEDAWHIPIFQDPQKYRDYYGNRGVKQE